ncbi:MAG: homoserine kinase [Balneolaceae bacterium]|nr:homoserine kinase [Balneolaceae bacterium]
MDEIKIFAPATVANVACGYDVMGFAMKDIGDTMNIRKIASKKWVIENGRGCEGLPIKPTENVIGVAVEAMMQAYGKPIDHGFHFYTTKNIKPGSGLGSSASSASAAVFGVNRILGKPFSRKELVKFAMEGERAASGSAHADNVAPCLLGGFTLIRSYDPLDVIELQYPDMLYASVVHPQIEIKTSDSKKILKKDVPLKDAITQWGNVGGLVSGLAKPDYELIGRSLQDVIAEPARSKLIPYFKKAKEVAMQEGALGASISGSGPSIFALSFSRKIAESIAIAFNNVYASNGILANVYISQVNSKGTQVLE